MTIFILFHQSSLHCEDCIALQREILERSLEEVAISCHKNLSKRGKLTICLQFAACPERPPNRVATVSLRLSYLSFRAKRADALSPLSLLRTRWPAELRNLSSMAPSCTSCLRLLRLEHPIRHRCDLR